MSGRIQDGQEKGGDEDGDTEGCGGAQAKGDDLSLSGDEVGKR